MNLHDLLEDAVADVEPTDRLAELRARTASPARAAARPWWWAAGATVVATAAAVTVVAVIDDDPAETGHDHHHMATHPAATTQVGPAYFIAATPDGDRLYRVFDQVPAGEPLQAALDRLQEAPADPDYRTAWPVGSLDSAVVGDGTIDVELGGTSALRMTDQLGVQQVVQTLQGVVGEQLPVRFLQNGQETIGTVDADPLLLNPVSISDPAEGNEYDRSFTARGRVRTGQRSLEWSIFDGPAAVTRVAGGTVGIVRGDGTFSPWSADVDLTGLAPGTYTFSVGNRDLGYALTFTDTRTIVVR